MLVMKTKTECNKYLKIIFINKSQISLVKVAFANTAVSKGLIPGTKYYKL